MILPREVGSQDRPSLSFALFFLFFCSPLEPAGDEPDGSQPKDQRAVAATEESESAGQKKGQEGGETHGSKGNQQAAQKLLARTREASLLTLLPRPAQFLTATRACCIAKLHLRTALRAERMRVSFHRHILHGISRQWSEFRIQFRLEAACILANAQQQIEQSS